MLISWEETIKLCPNITGIIHVGAHRAEERHLYGDIPTMWIEADPELFKALPVEDKYHFAATNYKGEAVLNIMPFRAANSLLQPNLNAKRRKDVYVESQVIVPADMISSIQKPGYNFINLDIQGAELNALKGTDLINVNLGTSIDYIYTECHKEETYHQCTQISELDEYLGQYNFTRIITKWTKRYGWGDCIFKRLK